MPRRAVVASIVPPSHFLVVIAAVEFSGFKDGATGFGAK
jgi:hypothetical protein